MDMGPLAPIRATGVSAAMASARVAVAMGGCPHHNAVPVELLDDGEIVAVLCPDCDAQLPAEWAVAPALPAFPPVPELPPFVPDPRLTAYIQE